MSELLIQRIWLGIALVALALASLMAVVLVIAKLPLLPEGAVLEHGFSRALVFHVVMSLVVWALAMVVWMWLRFLPAVKLLLDQLATVMALLGCAGLLLALLVPQGTPLLSNYIPVLDSSLFLASLLLFGSAATLVATARLAAVKQTSEATCLSRSALLLAALAMLVTLLVFGLALSHLGSQPLDAARAELLFWGCGHSLQAVFLMALVAGWGHLNGDAVERWPWNEKVPLLMLLMVALPLVIGLGWAPSDPVYRELFAYWMRSFSLPVLVMVMLLLRYSLRKSFNREASRDGMQGLHPVVRLSMGLFILGVLIGVLIRGDSLLVPAHYHATTGAVNLVFMGMVYQWLAGRRDRFGAAAARQLSSYGLGVVLMVAGLALSGWMGVGRKLTVGQQAGFGWLHESAMWLMGSGAMIGLLACAGFIGIVVRQLLHKREHKLSSARQAEL